MARARDRAAATMTKRRFPCRACGARLKVPDEESARRVRCARCHAVLVIPRAWKAPEIGDLLAAGSTGRAAAAGFHRTRVSLPRATRPGPALRRCLGCGRDRFDDAARCGCGAASVGLSVGKELTGRGEQAELALADLESVHRFARKTSWLFGGLAVAILAYFLLFRGALAIALFLPPWLLLAVLVPWIALRVVLRHQVDRRIGPRLPRPETADAIRRARGIHEELLVPFLSRNAVPTGAVPRPPASEASLLAATLAKRAAEPPGGELTRVLTASALVRDFEAFRDRLESLEVGSGYDLLETYALLYARSDDASWLPFLQQIRLERGEDLDPEAVRSDLDRWRETKRVEAFERDLERHRDAAIPLEVTIEEVDAMGFFAFEILLARIYESLGHRVEPTPKTGDQGADVVVERAGERTVIQAKLYAKPVGNAAVQQVVAAKAHYRCAHAAVATNATFTAAACELAESNDVDLIDRDRLVAMLEAFSAAPKNDAELRVLLRPREADATDDVPTLEPDDDVPELEAPELDAPGPDDPDG